MAVAVDAAEVAAVVAVAVTPVLEVAATSGSVAVAPELDLWVVATPGL